MGTCAGQLSHTHGTFEGSLPQFVAAFTRRNKRSDKEIRELRRLIDQHGEGDTKNRIKNVLNYKKPASWVVAFLVVVVVEFPCLFGGMQPTKLL